MVSEVKNQSIAIVLSGSRSSFVGHERAFGACGSLLSQRGRVGIARKRTPLDEVCAHRITFLSSNFRKRNFAGPGGAV